MRTLADILALFPGSAEAGLSPEDLARSRQQFGSNRLTPLPREPLWKKFLAKFDEPIITILLAAALLSMAVELFKPPVEATRYTAGAIVLGLAAVASTGAYLFKVKDWVPSILFLAA